MKNILLRAEKNVAFDSPDHLCPWGTMRDNSVNPLFNRKLCQLYKDIPGSLRVLDLGCSGGGFVKSCIDDGMFAIGLEGSDFSKRNRRAEWRSIPESLFTCDVSHSFQLLEDDEKTPSALTFNVITMWEVIEHIAEEDLSQLVKNVSSHLASGGIWVMSVSPNEEILNGMRLHQTVHPKAWWLAKLQSLGFVYREDIVGYFNTQYVRGPKYGGPGSFNLVLARAGDTDRPIVPKLSWREFLFDQWVHSFPHRVLKTIILGEIYI